MDARGRYELFLRRRHRPSHARRTAASMAAFFLPFVRSGFRLVDLGCGPASITVGLAKAVGPTGAVVGVDLDPGPAAVPLVRGDIHALPFPDASFDAVFMCAVLQHVANPLLTLVEARRVCRPRAFIGVADVDWGGALVVPEDPWLARGQEILERLRTGTSPHVGRHLRGLLHAAGFAEVTVTARGTGGGSTESVGEGAFQASLFDASEATELVVEEGIASASEMASVAAAWRRWGTDPAATSARHWFEGVARAAH